MQGIFYGMAVCSQPGEEVGDSNIPCKASVSSCEQWHSEPQGQRPPLSPVPGGGGQLGAFHTGLGQSQQSAVPKSDWVCPH